MKKLQIAQVIVDNKCKETDRIYSYGIPDEMDICIGHRVIVSFGRGNKNIAGYVIGIADSIDFSESKLKYIIKPSESNPLLSIETIELIKWMKEKYLCYYLDAIHAVLPANVRIKTTYYYEIVDIDGRKMLSRVADNKTLLEILDFIDSNGGVASKEELRDNFNDNFLNNSLRQLIKYKLLKRKQTVKKKERKKYEKLLYINYKNIKNIKIHANAIKQKTALKIIEMNPGISAEKIKKDFQISALTINNLFEKTAIIIKEKELYRLAQENIKPGKVNILTTQQQKALNEISAYFINGNHVLLHGVTGSGKTEIYLNLIDREISKGKQGIVLVPEISLTPQMIRRFVAKFNDAVAVIHSGLSDGEKYDEWRRIKEGKAKVVIGARSAIFAPFNNLGIIIIDEEHEHTYKSEIKPKYHAREIAEKRCAIEGCNLLLGSATPSIETYHKAKSGEYNYNLVSLKYRVNELPMPEIKLIDMREELKGGNKSIFGKELEKAIFKKLEAKEQIILFLNRRGFSTFVSCRACGYVAKCPHCNISLTYHSKGDYLSCHYCGYSMKNLKDCPSCKSKYIKYFGIGTQKVEEEFRKNFGTINVLRMDADTTIKKNSHKKILDAFRNQKADVLIGTQMIGKGHDFPNVTLVGIISADTFLNIPDFRAAERTFQMITQAAGRAGRDKLPGKVFIQTYNPEHYSLLHTKGHDYESFYGDEIKLRKELDYPPYTFIANIVFSGYDKDLVEDIAKRSKDFLCSYKKEYKNIEIWNPTKAPLSKIRNRYRWQIVLKSKIENNLINILKKFSELSFDKTVAVSMDINPVNML